jgi:hypothetical protein
LEVFNGINNIIVFGFAKGTMVWSVNWGYAKQSTHSSVSYRILTFQQIFGTLAGVFGLFVGMAIPLYFFGKRLRKHTSNNWRLISWKLE